MNFEEENNLNQKYKTYVRDKIYKDNEEKEEENKNEEKKNSQNLTFNLEYQKIINNNKQGSQTKITDEINKLMNYLRETYFYKDIHGKRITPKGELLPTPFQKLKRINEEIKSLYEQRLNKKNSPLIIKNYKNKNIYSKNNLTLNNVNKRKINNFFSSNKTIKDFGKINYNKYSNYSKNFKNVAIQNNINLLDSYYYNNQNHIGNPINKNKHKVCLTEIVNKRKNKYFSHLLFNQINFWNAKILNVNSSGTDNKEDNNYDNNWKYNSYITENKKRNNDYNLKIKLLKIKERPKINNNNNIKSFKSKSLYKIKSRDLSNIVNNYNLIQFNMNQLIRPDKYHKDKIIINTRRPVSKIKKRKMMVNKTVNVNMDNLKLLDF